MYVQFIADRTKRKSLGVEIGFQKIGQEFSNFQRIAFSSRVAGIRLKAKAKTGIDSLFATSKTAGEMLKKV